MKKLSLILAALVLFAGVSFAQSTTPAPAKTDKKEVKKTDKKAMNSSHKKADSKASTTTPAPAAK